MSHCPGVPTAEHGQPPTFTSRLRNRKIAEGNSMRFGCAVTSSPDATVTWYHGNNAIGDGAKYRISVSQYWG